MTHSDVIIGHVVTSLVKLYQEAPFKGRGLVLLVTIGKLYVLRTAPDNAHCSMTLLFVYQN